MLKFTTINFSVKILAVAKKSEVPTKSVVNCITLTLQTSTHGNNRRLFSPIAVANIKYSFLGIPLFEQYAKTSDFGNNATNIE